MVFRELSKFSKSFTSEMLVGKISSNSEPPIPKYFSFSGIGFKFTESLSASSLLRSLSIFWLRLLSSLATSLNLDFNFIFSDFNASISNEGLKNLI